MKVKHLVAIGLLCVLGTFVYAQTDDKTDAITDKKPWFDRGKKIHDITAKTNPAKADFDLALLCYNNDDFDLAIVWGISALNNRPNSDYLCVNIYTLLAGAHYHNELYKEALRYCDRALSHNSDNHAAYYFRGASLFNTGQPRSAIPELIQATVQKEDYAAAYFILFFAYCEIGETKKAYDAYIKAKKYDVRYELNDEELGRWLKVDQTVFE